MTSAPSFYVVPRDTDPDAVAALREQHAGDPSVTVVVDSRQGEARPSAEVLKSRRPILAYAVPNSTVEGARIEQHMPPIALVLADASIQSVVDRAAAHDPAAAGELRWRCHALVTVELTTRLGTRARAELAFPQAMDAIIEALPTQPPSSEFWGWLLNLLPQLPVSS
jgi:hypothetical protein